MRRWVPAEWWEPFAPCADLCPRGLRCQLAVAPTVTAWSRSDLIMSMFDSSWMHVGAVAPSALGDARLQCHHAVQIAVSATISYLPPARDDSHTALHWVTPSRALVTELIPADRPFHIALRPADLSLHALDASLNVRRSFALSGNDAGQGHNWLVEVARDAGLDASRVTSRKHYTIPTHPVAEGQPFALGEGSEFAELERYWLNASLVLEDVVRREPSASRVLLWPHHFDIATLIALPANETASLPTIGVGYSPGDEWYAEPYWYVSPRPSSEPSRPALEVGFWHTTGWCGAVLRASDYVAGAAAGQHHRVTSFADSAIRACRALF